MSNLAFAMLVLLVASLIGWFFGWDFWQHATLTGAVAAGVLDAFVDDWKA